MQRDPKILGLIIKSLLWSDSGKPQRVGQGIQGMQNSTARRRNRLTFLL